MGLPFSLMERALEIRKGLDREGSIKSLYNQNVFREECANCHSRIVSTLHTHHIEEQANGGSHHVRNLAVLCEDCHFKHHSGEIQVERLRVTSDGLERAVVEKSNKIQKAKYTEEELNLIKQSIYTLKGRPLARIRSDLKLKGIQITEREISTIQKQNG
jgi:type II secretory ATPase GspE/PulE/Tfp pilus assembly ATPase PilB-like protein